MSFKGHFIKHIVTFEYLELLIHYMISLMVAISSVLGFEMIILLLFHSISMKLILFYIPILLVLSILALITLYLFIYNFSNFYKTGGES